MSVISIGLTFPGTCEKAFNLYRSVFQTEFSAFIRYDDPDTVSGVTEADREKMAYVEMKVGGVVITGDDTPVTSDLKITGGNNIGITYEPESKKEADRVFNALAQGGKVISPNTDYAWGYCGALIDRFGVKWGFFYRTPRQM
jgi:PhnB protein